MGSARPGTLVKVTRFDFEFAPAYRLPALALGITPRTAWVEIDDTELRVRYGPWRLRTPLDNVSSAQLLPGPFRWYRTAGPPHLSLADKGVSFATTGSGGVCVQFHEPVKTLDPTGRLRHPGATLTVQDPARLLALLEERTGS